MRTFLVLFTILIQFGFFSQVANGQSSSIDYWQSFINNGSDDLQRFFQTTSIISRAPDSRFLGSNIAGYHLGRFGLHSLLWGHMAWARSPEYYQAATTDDQKRFYLELAKNKIDTMTSAPYYLDLSLCSVDAFKGSTHDGINKYEDGYNSWGHRRAFDAIVPLPEGLDRVEKGTWYKLKIRTVNNMINDNTTISVWVVPVGSSFPLDAYYSQTYRGIECNGFLDAQGQVMDNGETPDFIPSQVWFREGTVGLLSCFSNIEIKNLMVYEE